MKKKLSQKELQAVKIVQESVGDASLGLPEEVFELTSSIVPMINVDLLFQDERGRILMIWREDPICGCGWHIPGGIIRFKESIEERLLKTAQNELGTQVWFDPKPMAINELMMPYDLRGHFISLLYRCYLSDSFPKFPAAGSKERYQAGDICWHSTCPQQWVKGQRKVYGDLFELSHQEDNNMFFSAAKKMREGKCTLVFDIDGVVAKFDSSLQYGQAKPVKNVITIINHLYDCGNKIILFTARGSETGIDWSETTREQMKNWGVKYHQLRFGKPAATFYVDDKNLSLSELTTLAKYIGVAL